MGVRAMFICYCQPCRQPGHLHRGGGSRFEHHGIGCVIHKNAVFGNDCHVYQNVTVGAKWARGKDGVPQIGDRVQIGAGAVLLGPIRIGNDCIIGANAVVIQDVPDGCYALGVPAAIRKRSDVHNNSKIKMQKLGD